MILTVDSFLACYLWKKALQIGSNSQETLLEQVDYRAKIDSSIVMEREGDLTLFVESKKSWKEEGFSPKEKRVEVVFVNEDQREEFLEFA